MYLSLLNATTGSGGGGFARPAGDPDLAYVIWQVYNWMTTNNISFWFNGKFYSWSFWSIFVGFLVAYALIDIAYLMLYLPHEA